MIIVVFVITYKPINLEGPGAGYVFIKWQNVGDFFRIQMDNSVDSSGRNTTVVQAQKHGLRRPGDNYDGSTVIVLF